MSVPPEEPPEPPDQERLHLLVGAQEAAGVWSNRVLAAHTPHEITLDFVRMDPHTQSAGVVVARVSMSPILLVQLQQLLARVWQDWSQQQLPEGGPGGEPRPGTGEDAGT
jgi:hypothetical protein